MDSNRMWLLSEDFPSKGFPTFVFVEQLVFALVDSGVNVSVIAPQSLTKAIVRGRGILCRHSVGVTKYGNHFDIYRPYRLSFGNHLKFLEPFLLYVSKKGVKRVLNKRYREGDVLYGHFWSSCIRLLPFAAKYKAPLFVACGEGDNAMEEMAERMSDEQKLYLRDHVTGVISVSSENKRKSIDLGFAYEDRITVLPNCVDDTLFYPKRNDALKKELGINQDDFTIAFVGAFINRKGSKVLSEAIDIINQWNLKSIFIGAPLDSEDCSPTCDGIVFKGKIAHDMIPDYLACADAFVLPTQNEGCCNAIVEALACGIPVISSDRPFNTDILNEHNSILIDPNSATDIAEAIKEMMNNIETYMKYRRYAVEHAGDYSIRERARKIMEFIEKRIDNK